MQRGDFGSQKVEYVREGGSLEYGRRERGRARKKAKLRGRERTKRAKRNENWSCESERETVSYGTEEKQMQERTRGCPRKCGGGYGGAKAVEEGRER